MLNSSASSSLIHLRFFGLVCVGSTGSAWSLNLVSPLVDRSAMTPSTLTRLTGAFFGLSLAGFSMSASDSGASSATSSSLLPTISLAKAFASSALRSIQPRVSRSYQPLRALAFARKVDNSSLEKSRSKVTRYVSSVLPCLLV